MLNLVQVYAPHSFRGNKKANSPYLPQVSLLSGGGNGQIFPPVEVLSEIEVVFPESADPSFDHYTVLQIRPGQIKDGVTINNHIATIKLELGAGKIKNVNGFDVRFFDELNNPLNFKRQSFDQSLGKVNMQVLIPEAKAFTRIQMVYGKEGVTVDPANPTAVYNSSYKGVWDLSQEPLIAGDVTDSTTTPSNGTGVNMNATNQIEAQVNGGLDFDGDIKRVEIPNAAKLNIASIIKIKAWFKIGNTPSKNVPVIINKGKINQSYLIFMFHVGDANDGKIVFRLIDVDIAISHQVMSTISLDDDIFHQVVATYDGVDMKLYLDGVLNNTFNDPGVTIDQGIDQLVIGGTDQTALFNWGPGIIDEVELLDDVRADEAEFIKTQYLNEFAPNTFWERTPELTPGEINTLEIVNEDDNNDQVVAVSEL